MIEIVRYSPEEWRDFAKEAHMLVFKEVLEVEKSRIDFALLFHNGDEATAYVTCREVDSESLYWQFGGILEEFRGENTKEHFELLFEYTAARYRRVTAYVESENVKCIVLMLRYGLRVTGTRYFDGKLFLEMRMEFKNAVQKQSAEGLSLPEASKTCEEIPGGNSQG